MENWFRCIRQFQAWSDAMVLYSLDMEPNNRFRMDSIHFRRR